MKGHVLIVADGRSPTALSWIKNVQSLDYKVSLISTFACEVPENITSFHILPVAFSRFSTDLTSPKEKSTGHKLKIGVKKFTPLLQNLRYILGPLSLLRYAKPYQKLVKQIAPDFVHALRIPFEGMLASYTPKDTPLLVAIWGNDLTLHANASWLMKKFTNRCLLRADGLTSDTKRDIRLAKAHGLNQKAPTLIVPGSGGLDLEAIQNAPEFDNRFGIPEDTIWIVNPRGLRPGSVNQEVFFKAIPEILTERPDTSFICPNLKGQPQAQAWIEQFNIEKQTCLLPKLSQSDLWALFNKSTLFISPSSHDGTPNTLLEAMACECVPILGDIESLREWVNNSENGLLVDPRDPHALAQAVLTALKKPEFLDQAAQINKTIVRKRAVQEVTLPRIDGFYKKYLR